MAISRLFYALFLVFIAPLSILAQDIVNIDQTDNKGKVDWEWRVSLGDVSYNKPITAEFSIKNMSDTLLIIKDVVTGCHCTVIDMPKEPIQPGATAVLKATYDAKREGRFYKLIRVLTNFDQNQYVTLAMEGTVKARHN
jgi:Protein of unknown function (DUF1573)